MSGFDISQTAIDKAKSIFPKINFQTVDMIKDNLDKFKNSYDFLYIKDVLWYISDNVDTFKDNIDKILSKNGYVYIMNSVPDLENFYGQAKFPDTFSIIDYFSQFFDIIYASSTYETDTNRVFGSYNKDKYVRILLRKIK